MLPPLQLPVLEPGVTGASKAAETLLPEGATELNGAFAAILSTRIAPEAATGSVLPPTGNDLPLLTPPDPELPVSADLPLRDAGIELAAEWSDYELPIVEPGGRRLPLPDPAGGGMVATPVRTPLEALTQPDAASEHEPALRTIPATPAAGLAARTARLAGGDMAGRGAAAAPTPEGAARAGVAATAERTVRAGAATIAPQSDADAEIIGMRDRADMPLAGAAERVLTQRARETIDARPAPADDADGTRPATPAAVGAEVTRSAREDLAALLRPSTTTLPQPAHVGVESTQPIADVAARPLGDAPASVARAATAPSTLLTTLDIPVQDPRWEQAVSERIVVLASGRAHNAEIRLTPAELGPLRIQVTIEDGAANVAFQAQHALTREALEQAMPRLREMLSDSGLTLGQASVSEQGVTKEGREDVRSAPNAFDADADRAEQEHMATEAGQLRPRRGDALVDTFA